MCSCRLVHFRRTSNLKYNSVPTPVTYCTRKWVRLGPIPVRNPAGMDYSRTFDRSINLDVTSKWGHDVHRSFQNGALQDCNRSSETFTTEMIICQLRPFWFLICLWKWKNKSMTTAGLGATHGLHSLFSFVFVGGSFLGEFKKKLDHRRKKMCQKKIVV